MSIKDRLLLTLTEREKFDHLREALGLTKMEWENVLATKTVTECEQVLAKYLELGTEENR